VFKSVVAAIPAMIVLAAASFGFFIIAMMILAAPGKGLNGLQRH